MTGLPPEFYTLQTPQWLALNAAPGSTPNYSIDHRTSNVYDNQHIPENEQAMNNTISGSSKSRIHRPPQRDGGEPYEPAPFRPVGRQPELGGRKKDEGGAFKWSEETRQLVLDVEL